MDENPADERLYAGGEVSYTTSVRMPEALPLGDRFDLSSQQDAVNEVLVDDEVAMLLDGEEVFTYRFSSNSTTPEIAIVEVPQAVMEDCWAER